MISKYSVGFLIPKDAARVLSDDGWEFESDLRLPKNIECLLKDNFRLSKSSSNFSAYYGSNLKLDVFKDEFGEIENIYFRFYKGTKPDLPGFLKNFLISNQLEFFVP